MDIPIRQALRAVDATPNYIKKGESKDEKRQYLVDPGS